MFKTLKQIAVVTLLSLSLTGCFSAYVENKAPALSEIKPSFQPKPVNVQVEAYSNGEKNDKLQQAIQPKIIEVLNNTKVLGVDAYSTATLKVKVQENFDKGSTFAKGFLTGFTFFLVGTTSEANYTMDISLIENGAPVFNRQYNQKVYATAGATAGTPDNARKVDLDQAPIAVSQDLVLQFLKEYNH